MSLSPRARSIVDAALDGDEPTASDKDRIRRAVLASVAGTAAVGSAAAATSSASAAAAAAGSPAVSTAVSTATVTTAGTAAVSGAAVGAGSIATTAGAGFLAKVVGIAIVAGIGATTAVVQPWNADAPDFSDAPIAITDREPSPTPSAPPAAPPTPAVELVPAAPEDVTEPLAIVPDEPTPHPVATRARLAQREPQPEPEPQLEPAPPQGLREELSLLRAAHAARRSGDAAAALAHLDAHARAFPHGALTAEREAARVFALCDLGRAADARARADRFAAAHPDSPLLGRVADACP